MKTFSICNAKFYFLSVISVLILFSQISIKAQENKITQGLIRIDKIKEDEFIKGKVSNIDSPEKYKVLVYVHTDKWYVHPFAGQGEGKSWAGVKKDGSWSLQTVKREFTANKIVALIVDSLTAEDAPSTLENIEKIKCNAVIIYSREEMKSKGWYDKL
jgi:hypothetical protein